MADFKLNTERYVDLLQRMISHTEQLQNNPPQFVPQEDLAGACVIRHLQPVASVDWGDAGGAEGECEVRGGEEEAAARGEPVGGGPLRVRRFAYKNGRGNILVTYPATCAKGDGPTPCVSFVGAHLDVVPADPATWNHHPFKLHRDGDHLYARGTTDCLGHVAVLAELMRELGESQPKLSMDVHALFIASEESSAIPGVGVDEMLKRGALEVLKAGPAYWVDSADSQPCVGTATALQWKLRTTGKLFHSGLPHKAINAVELAMEAMSVVQRRFYEDFPAHEQEKKYNFLTPSTLKPTQIKCMEGSVNQIPSWCEIEGDARVTPFYPAREVVKAVQKYIDEINADVQALPHRGPVSPYVLPEEGLVGKVEFEFSGDPDAFRGIACNLESPGYKALHNATERVLGEVKPYSIGGSLPLVKELQEAGLDVQICGYGKSTVYHGDNEYCLLSDMESAMSIFSSVLTQLNEEFGSR